MEKIEFPLKYSAFLRKRNASYDGDPNGDYVMAEDVNELQQTIERLEQAVGVQELEQSVSKVLNDKVDKKSLSDFGSAFFVNYNGSSINAYNSIEERISAFSYVPHVMLTKETSSTFDLLTERVAASGTILYGVINCKGLSATVIENDINWFKEKKFKGITLSNFGFENGLTRSLQNAILGYIHDLNMVAVVTGEIETTLFNKPHVKNPLQDPLNTLQGDIYLTQDIFIVNGGKNDPETISTNILNLNKAQKENNLTIFVEDVADKSETNEKQYLYGKLLATLFNFEGYSLAPKSRYSLNEQVSHYIHGFELGAWQANNPVYVDSSTSVLRRFSRGNIIFDKVKNEVFVEGIGLSPSLYTWQDKQVPGAAVDLEDADYTDGVVDAIIKAINKYSHLIHYSKIDGLSKDGSNPDVIKDIVVRAINNSPAAINKNPPDGYDAFAGNEFIHGGTIDYIDASSIRTGTLNLDRIKANIIEAINAYIGTATIDQAFIGELTADHISASVVDAINIYAENISAERAKINQAVIGELTAEHIKSSVVEAINLYAGHAVIESAKIGEIEADKISTNVIKAVNAYIGDATIDNAKIGSLTANHIQGAVVDAINLYAGSAKIQAAQIDSLKAENIQAGLVEAFEISAAKAEFDSLQASVINAINASVKNAFINGALISKGSIGSAQIADASITDGMIVDLTANKINSGIINTGQVSLQGKNGHLRITGNRLQVFDDQEVPIERVSIGDVDMDGSLYGLRVRGEDGFTVLYDEKGVYSEGITDGAITNPKIAEGAVDGDKHIAANTITANKIVAESITAREIKSKSITANELMANTITAGSGIIDKGAIGTAEIANASIIDAHIKEITANKITAGSLQLTSRNLIPNASFRKGFAQWSQDSGFDIVDITTSVQINGTRSIQLVTSGKTTNTKLGVYSDHVQVSPGESYSASVYVLSKNISLYGGVAYQPTVSIEYLDSTNTKLSEVSKQTNFTANNEWQRISITGVSPAKTVKIRIKLSHVKNGDTYFSRPMLQKGTIVTEWTGDGSYMTEDGVYTGELTADQITTGRIKAELVEIGENTSFQTGYSPEELRQEIQERLPYRVEIISTNGIVFKRGEISTTLKANVYEGMTDVTDMISANRFIWSRVGFDGTLDAEWNQNHVGMKEVVITRDDVKQRASFLCDILEN